MKIQTKAAYLKKFRANKGKKKKGGRPQPPEPHCKVPDDAGVINKLPMKSVWGLR